MKTPVAFIIFNRPSTTEKVFELIRQAKPSQLLVIADGPRADRPDDIEKCAAARAVIDRVDWDCEVLKNFSDKNLGCGIRPATGINWVFDHVEEAIILEDDCVPHPTFFHFCEELLEKYRFDRRVMHISGSQPYLGSFRLDTSYVFSRYPTCWGWATWRRAWQHYDFDMNLWPTIKQKDLLTDIFVDQHTVYNWIKSFQFVFDGNLDCWDFQWLFSCWLQSGLSIVPSVNLVCNIGYGSDGTHTTFENAPHLNIPVEAVTFPLKHPDVVIHDRQVDDFIQDTLYDYRPKLFKRIKQKLNKFLK